MFTVKSVALFDHVRHVCVCVRERERERERASGEANKSFIHIPHRYVCSVRSVFDVVYD